MPDALRCGRRRQTPALRRMSAPPAPITSRLVAAAGHGLPPGGRVQVRQLSDVPRAAAAAMVR